MKWPIKIRNFATFVSEQWAHVHCAAEIASVLISGHGSYNSAENIFIIEWMQFRWRRRRVFQSETAHRTRPLPFSFPFFFFFWFYFTCCWWDAVRQWLCDSYTIVAHQFLSLHNKYLYSAVSSFYSILSRNVFFLGQFQFCFFLHFFSNERLSYLA